MFLSHRVASLKEGKLDREGEKKMNVLLEKYRKKAVEEGIEKGLAQGIQQGLEQGLEQGLQQGIEKGLGERTKSSCSFGRSVTERWTYG